MEREEYVRAQQALIALREVPGAGMVVDALYEALGDTPTEASFRRMQTLTGLAEELIAECRSSQV